MEIKPKEIIYTATENKDLFQAWRLVSSIVSVKSLTRQLTSFEKQMKKSPETILYPDQASMEQCKAIDEYNASRIGPVVRLKKDILDLQKLLDTLKEVK